ncbi:MAG: VWA domain-containing protein [Thermoanaerobaculales bacterium]
MNSRFFIRTFVLSMVVATVSAAVGAQPTPLPFGTTVEVRRILSEVRVVDDSGFPITGLGPEDFRVKINGRRVEVESASWIPTTREAAAMVATPEDGVVPSESIVAVPEPRLIVVLFQSDINLYRIKGVVRMAPQAAEFVRSLPPSDRVAFLTFESHLELRSDFTVDHEALAEMITATEILGGTIDPPEPSSPRMAEFFNVDEARQAATMTRALEVVARALIPLPGPKTLVFFGWGIGRYNRGHPITVGGEYGAAVAALSAARTSVYSLDITTADFHTLEAGLRSVSQDTGGIYFKTYLFPEGSMGKLVRVISSYYDLSIVPPPKLEGRYRIDVKVKRPGARVYVRQHSISRRR